MKKIDQLTSTRFLAALTVVLFHGGGSLLPFRIFPITPLFTSGPVSVSYFFVLSGFVMALVYYKPKEHFNVRLYWGARFARIYPVYLLSFLLVCLYYIDIIATIQPAKIMASVFMVQAWIPKWALSFNIAAWSLSVEAFFYLLFPFFIMWAYHQPLRRLIGFSIGFWAVSQLVHSGLMRAFMPEAQSFLYYNPLVHLNTFMLGVVGGIWFRTVPEGSVNQKTNRLLFFTSLVISSFMLIYGTNLTNNPGTKNDFTLYVGLLAPIFMITILTLALDTTRLSKMLSHPWLVLLGDASYSLYILHVPVRWLCQRLVEITGSGISYPIMYFTYLPMIIGLSVVVYLVFEKPSRQWVRRWMEKSISFSMRLFLWDILAISVSVGVSFIVRIGFGAMGDTYLSAFIFMLIIALIGRCILFFWFRLYNPSLHVFTLIYITRQILISTTIGSVIISVLVFLARTTGLVNGFPRSALVIEWAITFLFILLIRIGFRFAIKIRKQRKSTNR